jgi:hypothetical protein
MEVYVFIEALQEVILNDSTYWSERFIHATLQDLLFSVWKQKRSSTGSLKIVKDLFVFKGSFVNETSVGEDFVTFIMTDPIGIGQIPTSNYATYEDFIGAYIDLTKSTGQSISKLDLIMED